MNFFSKLFSSTPTNTSVQSDENTFGYLKFLFENSAEFYTQIPLFYHKDKQFIEYMMIHPVAGIILFNFFNYSAEELEGTTVSAAHSGDKNPEVKTDDIKNFIDVRLDELFHSQVVPTRTILICNELSEDEFDNLDKSFHSLIPKASALFNTSNTHTYKEVILGDCENSVSYELETIKRALFGEFLIAEDNSLMTNEQQSTVHINLEKKNLIQGLPGSGKSSVLIAKALYEKMKDPRLSLTIFAPRTCNVHQLQSMIFKLIENSHWGLNPADIHVHNFDTLLKLSKEKVRYDLIICDDINKEDVSILESLLSSKGKLLASSSYNIEGFDTYKLCENFRLAPAICAASEGFKVQKLNEYLSLQNNSTIKNTLSIIDGLLKDVSPKEISVLHYSIEELHHLQTAINHAFTPISHMHDDQNEGIQLYPLSHIACIKNEYIIILIDDIQSYDSIELITRAHTKTYILSEDKDVYQLIDHIKGKNNESY